MKERRGKSGECGGCFGGGGGGVVGGGGGGGFLGGSLWGGGFGFGVWFLLLLTACRKKKRGVGETIKRKEGGIGVIRGVDFGKKSQARIRKRASTEEEHYDNFWKSPKRPGKASLGRQGVIRKNHGG